MSTSEAKCLETIEYTYWMFVENGYAVRRKKDGREHWFPADGPGRAQHGKIWKGANDDRAREALDKFAKTIKDWR
jgi:hypothetical protein